MRRRLPARVHLPSGRVVQLSEEAARTAAAALEASPGARGQPSPRRSPCARDVRVLAGPSVLADAAGAPLDPLTLPLPDGHVLRALLAFAEVVPEDQGAFTCDNCGAAFEVAPSALLEIAPFVDGELGDPELDRPFDFNAWHPIPAVRVGRAVCRAARLAERTVGEALPLLRLDSAAALRLTPAVVTAMGLAGLGSERRAGVLADALAGAPDAAWAAIVDLYNAARYPARLVAVHRCAACGARNDLDVPLERELPRELAGEGGAAEAAPQEGRDALPGRAPGRRVRGASPPDLDAFEAKVRAAAERVYRARGVRNIALFVDADVPACDDGGEPLLGCYTPGSAPDEVGVARPPEIRIFYRAFLSQAREDPAFDLDAEIEETLDHEVTHHLHHLAGVDPLDDEERDEIERERVRRVGRAEATRRARRGALSELSGFARATWPAWVLVAAAAALSWCAGSTSF